ncbi:MAG: TonB-dependent receptor [candidate division WOR-3 bacterium]
MLLILIGTMYFELEGITVIGKRLEALPYQVEVIEVEDLITIEDLGEILEKKAGIYIYSYGEPNSLTETKLHGCTSKHTLIMLNGHRINDPKNGGFDLSVIPLRAVKKIEIIKGSSSVFQGSNAIGGIVNIITGEEVNQLKVQANSNSSLMGGIEFYKYGVNGNLLLEKGKGDRSNTDYERYSFSSNWEGLNLVLSHRKLGVPGPLPQEGVIPTFGDATATSLFDHQKVDFLDLSYNKVFPKGELGIVIQPVLSCELFKYNWKYSDYITGEPVEASAKYNTIVGQFNTKFLYKIASLEINLEKDKVWGTQYLPETTSFYPEEEKAGISLSLFKENGLFNNFLSLREDWYRSFGFHPSFTVGSRVFINPLEVFISIGSAFQAPTLNDLYYPNFSNSELKPESSMGLNGGIKIKGFSISGHIENIKDRIGYNEFWIPQNISKSRVFGIDVSAKGELNHISYSLGYSYLDGYDEEDDLKRELQYHPKHSLYGVVFHKGPINTEISTKWMGERKKLFYEGWKKIESDFIVDLGVSKEINNISFGFNVDNLLDAKYITAFGNSLYDRDYPGLRRCFNLWAKLLF